MVLTEFFHGLPGIKRVPDENGLPICNVKLEFPSGVHLPPKELQLLSILSLRRGVMLTLPLMLTDGWHHK